MKAVFIVLLLVGLAFSQAEDLYPECVEETGLTEAEVTEYLLDDSDEHDAKATKFLMCAFKKDGAIDEDGKIVVEKAQEAVKTYLKDADVSEDQQSLDCIQEKDTTEETILAIAKCVEKRKAELTNSKK